ncbi:NAD(+) diphosphatase [Pseudarthrobacter sp. J64]|uniref:NAD(+) diphosphatase n=1 Tax=Pseudarthrobacter sp. J64 TaxID=3116485 RepID=UPI002E813E11|nr:NAD(+) diphosphatase [Pseudarthrobacter sp. J64]MEE2568260.1 NAD(+) diphosphatase [Pseudarthrobacter sp. J64]
MSRTESAAPFQAPAAQQVSASHLVETVLPVPPALINRGSVERMKPGMAAETAMRPGTLAMVLAGRDALVSADGLLLLPAPELLARLSDAGLPAQYLIYLGSAVEGADIPAGTEIVLVVVPTPLPAEFTGAPGDSEWLGFRAVASRLNALHAALFVEASAIANWHAGHTHCPRCGTPTNVEAGGWVRRCPADNSEHYPRTDPAIIVTVVGPDGRLLLGGGGAMDNKMHSTLAGFVEPGESLEQAVVREIREEVGVRVTACQYLGSQPWPFPASLMLGFTAATEDPIATPDGVEVTRARWFTRAELQSAVLSGEIIIPSRLSIARALIEHWYGGPVQEPAAVV